MNDLAELVGGEIEFSQHPGQWRAWNSLKRFVCVIAGTQSGKTSWGPHWLLREMIQKGPGDYFIATPTFQLLEKKCLPEFKKLFETWYRLGTYVASPSRQFRVSEYGFRRLWGREPKHGETATVWFGYAEDPESLESATAKAAWLDEAGQKKFKLGSWEAILRRLSLAEGRVLITTTPYDLGWLKQKIHDPWKAGDPDIDVIRFDSTENPQFPVAEFERARRSLPKWKFDMFYRGIFTRPAGMIYDNFNDEYAPEGHKCKPFAIPNHWKRYLGLDFGGVNTAGVFYAEDPNTRKLYLYREYLTGSRTAAQHAFAMRRGEPNMERVVGGSQSEGQWRAEFRAGGLEVFAPPLKDVEPGINRVYACHADNGIIVFDTCIRYLEQKMTYARELDETTNEPTEKIADKETFHLLDAERYIIQSIRALEFNEPGRIGRAGGYA